MIFVVINVSKKSHVKWNDEMINEALSLGGGGGQNL